MKDEIRGLLDEFLYSREQLLLSLSGEAPDQMSDLISKLEHCYTAAKVYAAAANKRGIPERQRERLIARGPDQSWRVEGKTAKEIVGELLGERKSVKRDRTDVERLRNMVEALKQNNSNEPDIA